MVNPIAIYNYKKFNDAANKVFFDGRFSDKPIYLDLERENRIELSELVSVSESNFEKELCLAVVRTLDWSCPDIYVWHTRNSHKWKISDWDSPPPFTALLLAFSLAAEKMRADGGISSNNYYVRLAELFYASAEPKLSTLRSAGKHTLEFWLDLNKWLRSFDNEVGVPTATTVYENWKYVGYALSQCLVRDGDKKRLHRMFLTYRLVPGDLISPSEMSLYLDEWLSHVHAPSWLRRLWENVDLRDKVAQAASEELQIWEGGILNDHDANSQAIKCNWIAVRKSFPKKKIIFYVTLNESVFDEVSILRIKLEQNSFNVSLQNLAGTDESFVVTPSELSLKALLGQNFKVLDINSKKTAFSQARPIIALCKVDDGNHFREVSRVRSHRTHMILCHVTWRERVEKHLRTYANSAITCSDNDGWSGIPEDWVCFSDVIFDKPMNSLDTVDNQIQLLVPFAEIPSIQPMGGLKLSHGIWHANAIPTIVIPPIGKNSQNLLLKQETIADSDVNNLSFEEPYSEFLGDIFNRVPFNIAGKDFVLSAGSGIRDLHISFRTADNVKRKLIKVQKRLFWSVSEATALVTPSYDEPKLKYAEGLHLSADFIGANCVLPSWAGFDQSSLDFAKFSSNEYEIVVDGGSYIPAECILRGYHYWICEPYLGPNTGNSRLVVCKDCDSRVVLPDPRNGRFRARSVTSGVARKIKHTLSPQISFDKPHIDTVIDTLCYKISGSWEALRGLLASVCDTPKDIGEYAHRLSDAGVLDLSRDLASGSVTGWVVPPPVLIFTTDHDRLMLTGFRCPSLIKALNEAFSSIAEYTPHSASENAITTHFWRVKSDAFERLNAQLDGMKDPLGRPIKLIVDPCLSILRVCPTLSELERYLPDYHLASNSEIEFFDLMSGKWRNVDNASSISNGAYRLRSRGNMYFYRNFKGQVKRGPFEVVKTLAARDACIPLHQYDNHTNCFKCVLGADLPPLLSRTLVVSSGAMPIIRDGLIHYPDISEELAKAVLYKLYN